ncbi:MAG TPA: hypothetical protein VI520_02880 [Anaerolineales bacterium]|nr:hypothetical protein [Anaerolineales bacterium]
MTPGELNPDRLFPSGTQRIYAVWDYSGMRAGLHVRREWYRDGELWLVREEPWDLGRYGSSGRIGDISIFDFDYGLIPGSYDLQLSIDGEFASRGGFFIWGYALDPVWSPDGASLAAVRRPGTLLLEESDGSTRELVEGVEISHLVWHPDGEHLLYAVIDRPEERDPYVNTGRFELWTVDVLGEEAWRISLPGESLRDPLVSPGGGYAAAFSGSGFGDACFLDTQLVVLELGSDMRRIADFGLGDFLGVLPTPLDPSTIIFPFDRAWRSESQLEVSLAEYCTGGEFESGRYLLDLETMTGQRIGDTGAP